MGPRLVRIFAGITATGVITVTLLPRQMAGPARAALMDFLHFLANPLVTPLTYTELESLLNAVLFTPVGAALTLLLPSRVWALAPVIGLTGSAMIEITQAQVPGRVTDVNDIIWNTLGALTGTILIVLGRQGVALIRYLHRRNNARTPPPSAWAPSPTPHTSTTR